MYIVSRVDTTIPPTTAVPMAIRWLQPSPVAKNGILIVEFANQKQEAGEDKMSAIKDAALQRLRPILMTSASTVLGLIPLAFATGEGCNQRIAMGTAVVGGMVVSTLLTMYIVPAIYSYISTNRIKKLQE